MKLRAIFEKLLLRLRLRRRTRIIGLGKFDCGPTDLATNKKHMEGYGE